MYIQIKKIEEKETKFWKDYYLKMIWLYEDDWKWIKWIKIDEVIDLLCNTKIQWIK